MDQVVPNITQVFRKRGREAFPNLGKVLLVIPLVFVLTASQDSGGSRPPPTEYEIKAALLLNFARFIQWPVQAFSDASAPILVGVLGDDPFGAVLDQTLTAETVQGRTLVVHRSRQADDLRNCHMVFVSRSERDRLGFVLSSLKETYSVTIGEMPEFCHRGGIINFYPEQNKVHFEINVDAAERKKVKISSQLLVRAKVVGPETGKD